MEITNHPYRKGGNIDYGRLGMELVSVEEDNGEVVVKHPGISAGDLDIDQQPKIWIVLGWTRTCRQFAYIQIINPSTGDRFLDIPRLALDRLFFLNASEVVFTKHIYESDIKKRPLFMKVFGGHIGKTSFTTVAELKTASGELLLTSTNQLIGIDLNTRKSKLHPEWYIDRHAHKFKKPPLHFSVFERPPEVKGHSMQVQWTDLDENDHAMWCTYVTMTLNAASLSVKTGLIKNFRQNKLRGLHRLQMLFLGESVDGDNLDVYVWEETHNVLKSDICKNGKSIFQGVFQFFEH